LITCTDSINQIKYFRKKRRRAKMLGLQKSTIKKKRKKWKIKYQKKGHTCTDTGYVTHKGCVLIGKSEKVSSEPIICYV